MHLIHPVFETGAIGIDHNGQAAETWDNLAQQLEALAGKTDGVERQAGRIAVRSGQTCDEVAANRVARNGDNWDERCRAFYRESSGDPPP